MLDGGNSSPYLHLSLHSPLTWYRFPPFIGSFLSTPILLLSFQTPIARLITYHSAIPYHRLRRVALRASVNRPVSTGKHGGRLQRMRISRMRQLETLPTSQPLRQRLLLTESRARTSRPCPAFMLSIGARRCKPKSQACSHREPGNLSTYLMVARRLSANVYTSTNSTTWET